MKKLISLVMLFFTILGVSAQNEFKVERVIQADSVSKEDLYATLKLWITENFNSPKKVLQMDDKDIGILMCNTNISYKPNKLAYLSFSGYLNYSIKFRVKDGRYKVEIGNVFHEIKPGNAKSSQLGLITTADYYTDKGLNKGYQNKVWLEIKAIMINLSDAIFTDVENFTANNMINAKEDDNW